MFRRFFTGVRVGIAVQSRRSRQGAASFSLFDLIFFGLGAVTAFIIGSGAGREAA